MRFIVSWLVLSSTVHAATNPAAVIWARKDQPVKCVGLSDEIAPWHKDVGWEKVVLTKEQLDRAIAILGQIPYPATGDGKVIEATLKNDFAENYLKWLGVANHDCPQLRLTLAKALIATAKAKPEVKSLVEAQLKTMLMVSGYPILLGVAIDGVIFGGATSEGFWQGTQKLKDEAMKFRLAVKAERLRFQKAYQPAFDELNALPRDASVAQLKALKSFDKIKVGALEEIAFSNHHYETLHALLADIGPK